MVYQNELSVDINAKGCETVYAKQGDFETRLLLITLLQDGEPYTIEDDVAVRIAWNKPDGNQVLNDCAVENGKIKVVMTQQMLIEEGEAQCEIMLFKTDQLLTTALFTVVIVPAAYDSDVIESSSEYTAFTNKLADIDVVLSEATQTAQEAAKTAEEAKEIADTVVVDENERKENEKVRAANETQRQTNESGRVEAENIRVANENQRIANETQRVEEWSAQKSEIESVVTEAGSAVQAANDATDLANSKASLADEKATLADTKAGLAQSAATSADTAAQSANTAASNADSKAQLADEKATLAQTAATAADSATVSANNAADRANSAAEEIEKHDYEQLVQEVEFIQGQVDNFPTTYVPSSRKINNKSLSADITLTASELNAAPINHASTSTTYGTASTTQYGHVKFGTDSASACVGNDARLMPTGSIIQFGGSSAPSGYLFCRGQAVSRTTYSALFNVIGTTYGSGNGSTTFNVPDLQTRTAVGYKSGDSDFGTLGNAVGNKTKGLVAQIGAFDGALNSIGYNAVSADSMTGETFYSGAGVKDCTWASQDKTPSFVTKVSDYQNNDISLIQPSLTVNYIIKY